jgi:hypothetical protein
VQVCIFDLNIMSVFLVFDFCRKTVFVVKNNTINHDVMYFIELPTKGGGLEILMNKLRGMLKALLNFLSLLRRPLIHTR